jgi:hypothetical protein
MCIIAEAANEPNQTIDFEEPCGKKLIDLRLVRYDEL